MNLGRIFTREEILERLKKSIAEGKPILGAGVSTGLVAKCAELGGADLLIVYSTGLSRHKGLPTSFYGDSNAVTMDMFDELDNVVKDTPIIAGIEAADPYRQDLDKLVKRFIDKGFSGVINFPTVGLFDKWRKDRESVGFGFDREVNMMRIAREKYNWFTMAYVFNVEDTRKMAEVPVDVMCPHAGPTRGGLVGYEASPFEAAAKNVQSMIDATKAVNPDIICLAHGGPFAVPEDTVYLYEHTDALGFVGASSIERIPIEKAVTECVKGYKSISLKRSK